MMKCNYISIKKMFLLLVFQGYFTGLVCQDWSFTIPRSITALKGHCVEIPCTFTSPSNQREFRLIWFLYQSRGFPQIYNSKYSSAVIEEYRGRTFMVKNKKNSCTLRIYDVEQNEEYYPGINDNINSYYLNDPRYVQVKVSDTPEKPSINNPGVLTEGRRFTFNCSVPHTCASHPPSLKWNKNVYLLKEQHIDLSGGKWMVISTITFSPSYQDDKTLLACKAEFPKGQESKQTLALNIKYSPKNTTISVQKNERYIKEGDNVDLLCTTHKANPAVITYTWYKVWKNIQEELQEHGEMMTVRNVSWENVAYYCSAWNEVGKENSTIIKLNVLFAAKGVEVLREKNVFEEGKDMELECKFLSSNPKPTHYTWFVNDFHIHNETRNKLKISHLQETDSGNYRCIVHNKAGESSSLPISITVTSPDVHDQMPLILGSIACIIALVLLLLVLYIFIRSRRVQKPTPTKNRNEPNVQENISMDEHLYGNVQPEQSHYNHTENPGSMRNPTQGDATNASGTEEVYYSNIKVKQKKMDSAEIDYASIQHVPPNQDTKQKKHLKIKQREHSQEVQYTSILHVRPNQDPPLSSHTEETEYVNFKY